MSIRRVCSPLEIDTAMKQSIVPPAVARMLAENESAKAKAKGEGRVTTDVAKIDPIGLPGVGEYVMAREVTYTERVV